jgi:hypothetical protein
MNNTLFKKKKVSLIGSKYIKYYKKKLRKNNNEPFQTKFGKLNQKTMSFNESFSPAGVINSNHNNFGDKKVQDLGIDNNIIQNGGDNISWQQYILNSIKEFIRDNYGFLILLVLIIILLYIRYIEVLKRKEKINQMKKHFLKEEAEKELDGI